MYLDIADKHCINDQHIIQIYENHDKTYIILANGDIYTIDGNHYSNITKSNNINNYYIPSKGKIVWTHKNKQLILMKKP